MFTASRLVFYYAVSPVHMGAGSAIGAIDSPIQREVHTRHPVFAGSGIKGAVRHLCRARWAETDSTLVNRIFGPETTGASEHAGAISFGDAQVVALPVRSLKGGFCYVTSPVCLGRLARAAQFASLAMPAPVPVLGTTQAIASSAAPLGEASGDGGRKVVLEAFELTCEVNAALADIARWLGDHALAGEDFFSSKLANELVMVSDEDFSHFAEYAMVVEPHVRIDDTSGTASDGGLFYVENLPPEALMAGTVHASVERRPAKGRSANGEAMGDCLLAEAVLGHVFEGAASNEGLAGQVLQIGGDATTGRGLVRVQPVRAPDA